MTTAVLRAATVPPSQGHQPNFGAWCHALASQFHGLSPGPSSERSTILANIFSHLRQNPLVDLAGKDLSHANLSRADLRWANLRGTNLAEANLAHADLGDADLHDANLAGADLTGAKLGVWDLGGADLRGANLTRTLLTGYNDNKEVLWGTDFCGTNLDSVTFTGRDGRANSYGNKAFLTTRGAVVDVTEAEWLACPFAGPLLSHVRDRLSARKQVLLAAAKWPPSTFEVPERFVDGNATPQDLDAVAATLDPKAADVGFSDLFHSTHADDVCRLRNVLAIARGKANLLDPQMQGSGEVAEHPFVLTYEGNAFYVRDVFGNPFRPFEPDAALLAWNNGAIPALAQRIYDERAFELMPQLAETLEAAGCTQPSVLAHCRERHHVRGCFVIDALLGRSRSARRASRMLLFCQGRGRPRPRQLRAGTGLPPPARPTSVRH